MSSINVADAGAASSSAPPASVSNDPAPAPDPAGSTQAPAPGTTTGGSAPGAAPDEFGLLSPSQIGALLSSQSQGTPPAAPQDPAWAGGSSSGANSFDPSA